MTTYDNQDLILALLNESENNFEFIKILFARYIDKKKDGTLFDVDKIDNNLAEFLIKIYYESDTKKEFDDIVYYFKREYIINENKVEEVHSKEERRGLGVVYDYIRQDDWIIYKDILAALICQINSLL
jgi:hypothetical protein